MIRGGGGRDGGDGEGRGGEGHSGGRGFLPEKP